MAFDYTNYNELEWVETNKCYFNTGITTVLGTYNMKVAFPSWPSAQVDDGRDRIIGGGNIVPLEMQFSTKKFLYLLGGSHRSSEVVAELDTIYQIQTVLLNGSQSMTINGNTAITRESSSSATGTNLLIGGSSYGGTAHYSWPLRIYNVNAFDSSNNEFVNLLPCKRKSDGVFGLYDTVNDNFIQKSGTGAITPGPIVPPPFGVKFKANGEWTDASFYIKIDGAWKEATPFIKINGTWKQGG